MYGTQTFILILIEHLLKLRQLVVLRSQQVNQLILYSEMDHFSPDNHQQNQVLKDIHEVIFSLAVEFRQVNLSKVFLLLDEVVLKTDIPAERVTKLDQKPSIALCLDKICGLKGIHEDGRILHQGQTWTILL